MDIRSSQNEISDLPLKIQSEMQLCKLKESESRPNITLKKIGQELDIAETKCFTLKSELNYMMGFCRKAQTEVRGNRGTPDISHERATPSFKNSDSRSFVEHDDNCNSEITAANKDISYLSPRSAQFSPRRSTKDDDIIEKCESASVKEEKKRARLLNVTITPRVHLDNKLPPITTTMTTTTTTVQNETAEAAREYKDLLSCYPECVREHLQSILNEAESVDKLASEVDENCFPVKSSSAKGNIEKMELNLDTSEDTKVRRAERSRHTSRLRKNETNAARKAGDATPKVRRRKGKLRSSASKSTVATLTKDTSRLGRREVKKRRCRGGHDVAHRSPVFPKHPSRPSNDVVEIFHNTTLKSSNSGISSKPSKLDREAKRVERQHPPTAETATRKIQEEARPERINRECQSRGAENQQSPRPRTTETAREQNDSEGLRSSNSPVRCKAHTVIDRYNELLLTRNYEMPTLASKLKRSSRSYYGRFNFHNIPFVVGTSVTPSHNLGLNIQQVLSMMKTKQPIASDIAPLLIRELGRGMKSASILLEQMSGQCERSVLDLNARTLFTSGMFCDRKESSSVGRDKRLPVLDRPRAGRARSVQQNPTALSFNDVKVISESGTPRSARNRQGISRMSLNRENVIGDHKTRIADSRNSKEIRDTLINLHDQFEAMSTKYEKLQSEAEKSSDKTLAKELSALEKELNAKEEEISTVVGLYKEVMMLKQQMNTLHEKNSLVCVATEWPAEPHKNPFPISIAPRKSHLTSAAQIFGRRKGNVYGVTREPPTSMQLAALLRQIQTFHKQLQLVS